MISTLTLGKDIKSALVYSHNLDVLVHRSTLMQCAVLCTSDPNCVATYYKDSVCHQSDGVGLTRAIYCPNRIDALIVDSSSGGLAGNGDVCLVTSGTVCSRITSKIECEEAAQQLGLSGTTASEWNSGSNPQYCFTNSDGTGLRFNSGSNINPSSQCSSFQRCICRA